MGYLYLALAISLELIGTTCLKYSEGFTKLYPSLATLAAYGLCFYLFSKSLLYLHLSIAYAIWCAIGIVAATLISVFLFFLMKHFLRQVILPLPLLLQAL